MNIKHIFVLAALAVVIASPALAADSPLAVSPLAEYPGFGHDPKADDDQFDREEMAREQLVSRCMERQGFIYKPRPSLALDSFATPSEAMAAMRDDPNGKYERALPVEEQGRYRMALWGADDPFADEADAQPDPLAETGGGCRGDSLRALPGVFAAKASLQQALDEMRRQVLGDVRLKAAEDRWAACMRSEGHTLDASPRALEQRQDGELAKLVGLTKAAMPPKEVVQALGRKHRAERELTMECALKVDLPGAMAKVRAGHESLFVIEHRETLDRHRQQFLENQALLEEIEATYP